MLALLRMKHGETRFRAQEDTRSIKKPALGTAADLDVLIDGQKRRSQ